MPYEHGFRKVREMIQPDEDIIVRPANATKAEARVAMAVIAQAVHDCCECVGGDGADRTKGGKWIDRGRKQDADAKTARAFLEGGPMLVVWCAVAGIKAEWVTARYRMMVHRARPWEVEGVQQARRRQLVSRGARVRPSVLRRSAALVVTLLLLAGTAQAQDHATRDALAWPAGGQHAADVLSTTLVAGALAAPCLETRTWDCVEHEAVRVGVAVFVAELTKRLVQRARPDGSDDKSFFSEHTAIACAATLGSSSWALCPSVGYLRIAANKHWLSDVGTGAGVGALVTFIW